MTTKNEEGKNQYQMISELLDHLKMNGEYLSIMSKQLEDIKYLLNGFTSGGASLNGYLPDSSMLAYLSLIGPALARHLDKTIGLEEILKGGVHLSSRMVEEYAAYQSERQPLDNLKNSLEFLEHKEGKAD